MPLETFTNDFLGFWVTLTSASKDIKLSLEAVTGKQQT